ncbi:hypothetical protein OSB04_024784 [Centaurea solstitialis]|uniref:Uncharacterized protein n=1 Tax=Centaurea solstitialis TaxID=347529 RepID=A0AA38W107_9ASTR|nr:hypothetical protein OSB04_024784 [Centaurea solstitialis]
MGGVLTDVKVGAGAGASTTFLTSSQRGWFLLDHDFCNTPLKRKHEIAPGISFHWLSTQKSTKSCDISKFLNRNYQFPNWTLVSRFGTVDFPNRNSSIPESDNLFPELDIHPTSEHTMSKEIISIDSETQPPVLVVDEY